MKAAVQEPPAESGIELANWNWKVVRQFVSDRYCIGLSRSSCLNWLHRLGFALKRPKKRLLKADQAKRKSFVEEYAALWEEAERTEARIFFADEAHFRADAELRGKWVLKGEPALVDSSSPRYGEKASYYSAVCLETGQVEWMELDGNSNSGTSAAFLEQLREGHTGPLTVIWDNAPAHRGEAVREFLQTPGLGLRLVNLPGYSPDFNADEAVWGWAREEATGNLCLGTKALVQERVGNFLQGLSNRKDEVKRRCRTVLQSRAETLRRDIQTLSSPRQMHIPPWLWFSSSAILNCWVKGFQLDARVIGGEAPVHSHHVPVALVLPGVNFPAQHLLIRNPAVQALPGQHSDFNFSHVQPTPMLGGVVNLQTFGDTPRFHRLEGLV